MDGEEEICFYDDDRQFSTRISLDNAYMVNRNDNELSVSSDLEFRFADSEGRSCIWVNISQVLRQFEEQEVINEEHEITPYQMNEVQQWLVDNPAVHSTNFSLFLDPSTGNISEVRLLRGEAVFRIPGNILPNMLNAYFRPRLTNPISDWRITIHGTHILLSQLFSSREDGINVNYQEPRFIEEGQVETFPQPITEIVEEVPQPPRPLATLFEMSLAGEWIQLCIGHVVLEEHTTRLVVVDGEGIHLHSQHIRSGILHRDQNENEIAWANYDLASYFMLRFIGSTGHESRNIISRRIILEHPRFFPFDIRAMLFVNNANRELRDIAPPPTLGSNPLATTTLGSNPLATTRTPLRNLFGTDFIAGNVCNIMILRLGRPDAIYAGDIVITSCVLLVWVVTLFHSLRRLARTVTMRPTEWRVIVASLILIGIIISLDGVVYSAYQAYHICRQEEVDGRVQLLLAGSGVILWSLVSGLVEGLFAHGRAFYVEMIGLCEKMQTQESGSA